MFEHYGILKELLRDTALATDDAFFRAAVRGLARLLGADFAFIARLRDAQQGKMEVLASCRDGEVQEHWWFDLPGTPCSVLYAVDDCAPWVERRIGGSVRIGEAVSHRFDSVRDASFECFIGIPLHDSRRSLIGHIALFYQRRWDSPEERDAALELSELFSFRVQSELNRCMLEERREEVVRELERANELLLAESITDHLTKLHNRRHFAQRMQEAFAQFRRCQRPYALLVLDLDHFKAINDGFGHDIGDEVLRAVAQALRANCRADAEPIFRIGGEEFAVLCVGELAAPALQRLGERLNAAIRATRIDSAPGLCPSVSVGGAWPRPGDSSWSDVYRRADKAMYRAKQAGRDRTELDAASEPQRERISGS